MSTIPASRPQAPVQTVIGVHSPYCACPSCLAALAAPDPIEVLIREVDDGQRRGDPRYGAL